MQSEKSGVLFARIAGILFLVYYAYWMYDWSCVLVLHVNMFFIFNIILNGAGLIFGILVLIGKRNKSLIIATGINVALTLGMFFIFGHRPVNRLNIIGWFILFVSILFLTISNKKEQLNITKVISFFPAGVYFFRLVISGSLKDYLKNFLNAWEILLNNLFCLFGLLFIGLWIWCECSNKLNSLASKVPVNVNFANSSNTHSSTASSVIGGADKLKAYKELLDSGVITEEEFEKMKQEVLGL